MKKQFQTNKPRSEWRKPVRRKRVLASVVTKLGNKYFWFEFTPNGCEVRAKHGRTVKTWSYSSLANGCDATAQMEMFLPKAKELK